MNSPISVFVPPFPADADDYSFLVWGTAVAGTCRGMQTIENNTDTQMSIDSIITGVMVHIEGTLKIGEGYLSNVELLPVYPKNNGFLFVSKDGSTNLEILNITADSIEIDASGLSDGTYNIKASYFKGDR